MQTLFKKFNVISCLKKTEYSSVYLADHIFLEKRIILKTLDSNKVPDHSDLHRFQHEAKILAKLNHPNIIRVLDFGTFENYVYISFEYFEAQTLRQIINTGNLTAVQKIDLLKQTVRGLQYAHKNNIIHRDIKPENILIDKNYNCKIADFGLALSDDSRTLTDPQSMMGTPAYASPEQVSGAELTPASDLFSLGLVAYELYKNSNPVLGKDISQTLNNILNFDEEILNALVNDLAENEKIIIKDLLNPEPNKRKIPENLLGNNDTISVDPSPVFTRVFWIGAAFVIIFVSVYYIWFTNAAKDDFVVENKDPIFKAADTTVNKIVHSDLQAEKSDLTPYSIKPDTAVIILHEAAKKYAHLQVVVEPEAVLYIDSIKYGSALQKEFVKLDTGRHRITLKNDMFPEYQQDIELIAGEQKLLNIDLKKHSGVLKVFTYPWALVEIDGKSYGQTPLEEPIRLSNGSYIMELKNPGFDTYKNSFKIKGADTVIIQHNFMDPGLGIKIE